MALLPVLVMVFVMGGCADGPKARPWAASVCEALTPWRGEITALNRRAQQQMTAGTTPAQAKENLVRLLSGAQAASETARDKVSDAGVPDVSGGAAVAHGFVHSLTVVGDAYARAKEAVERLTTAEAKTFYDGVTAVLGTLNKEYSRGTLDTTKLDSPELERAFDEVPECR